jgi:hypothetical protein
MEMADDSLRKMLDINDAAVEAARRLRESDSIAFKLAEQARRAMGMAASHPATEELASRHSALIEFAQHDQRIRELALEFTRPLAPQNLLEDVRQAGMIPRLAIGPLAKIRDAEVFAAQQRILEKSLAVTSRMLETFEAGSKLPSSM